MAAFLQVNHDIFRRASRGGGRQCLRLSCNSCAIDSIADCGYAPKVHDLWGDDMARKTTPEKPPGKRIASEAGKGLSTGKLSKTETRSVSGRVASERAAAARAKKK
jgi:hypothetical protein